MDIKSCRLINVAAVSFVPRYEVLFTCGLADLGMLGSIEVMHSRWKNYPFSWNEQYKAHVGESILIVEAVASHDL